MVTRRVSEESTPYFDRIDMNKPAFESPFLKPAPRQMSFTMVLLLLLMVIAAGLGLLIYNALRVPAVTMELDAWLGRQSKVIDTADGREAQIVFVMFCYSAPLILGILVYTFHQLINFFENLRAQREIVEDERFRMTD
jgi:uncharacterized membrane protein AbrB (regulator of aidB expression)